VIHKLCAGWSRSCIRRCDKRSTGRSTKSRASIVLIEAIKLLEGELAHIVDQVWVTRASASHADRAACRLPRDGRRNGDACGSTRSIRRKQRLPGRMWSSIRTGRWRRHVRQFEIAWERLTARARRWQRASHRLSNAGGTSSSTAEKRRPAAAKVSQLAAHSTGICSGAAGAPAGRGCGFTPHPAGDGGSGQNEAGRFAAGAKRA
jgi:hypothetical protein